MVRITHAWLMKVALLVGGFLVGCLALGATALQAENVDLSTVPVRDRVQLTIYNGEDLTLVRDVRTVTFKKGDNPLQFSWAGTRTMVGTPAASQ